MVTYNKIYPGTKYLLDPNYGRFVGYRIPAGKLGASTSVQTANQLKEVTNLLNQGIENVEVSTINLDTFEMIPKEQFKEINRLSKLTGAKTSLHAPIIEPAGFTEQGWSESNQKLAERQLSSAVLRARELDPEGNVPVTIHASSIPGSENIPDKEKGEVMQRMVAVDKETGQLMPLNRELKFYPNSPEGKMYEPEKELEIANASYWDNKLSQIVFYKERADELMAKYYPLIAGIDLKNKEDLDSLTPEQKVALQNMQNAKVYLDNTYQFISGLFNQASKYSDEEGKNQLKQVANQFKESFSKHEEGGESPRDLTRFSGAVQGLIGSMQVVTSERPPEVYQKIEDFAQEKTSETLSNVALNSYKQHGENSPIISIENPPYGQAFGTGEDLKKLVEKTREEFQKKLVIEGKDKSEAKRIAEKLIGVTWDTSHMSMIRKQGFGADKVTQETKTIAPFIKHVHLNDNLGTSHTDLPIGMGNLPMKDILEILQKKAPEAKKIFEGGNFFQHFQTSPHPYQLEGVGSPYFQGGGSPYWNQGVGFSPYFGGQGPINPPIHHSVWGSGYTNLPMEFGGEVAGGQSRLAGTPNQ